MTIRMIIVGICMALYGHQTAHAQSASGNALKAAEEAFWQAAFEKEHTTMLSAYLLHFAEGRFADRAAALFRKKTGTDWTDEVKVETAWQDAANDTSFTVSDTALAGQWRHTATCDINFFLRDVQIKSRQDFQSAGAGRMKGTANFRHGDRLDGRGNVLEVRRNKSLITYVMQAENNITGAEVHIGILNLSTENGQLKTRGWEMNTGGAYCTMSGQKVP